MNSALSPLFGFYLNPVIVPAGLHETPGMQEAGRRLYVVGTYLLDLPAL